MRKLLRRDDEEKAREQELERLLKEYKDSFRSLSLFPGNLAEYERFVGCECVIIDTGKPQKFVEWKGSQARNEVPLTDYSFEFQKKMFEEGVEALIHYSFTTHYGPTYIHTGVPVKKKHS